MRKLAIFSSPIYTIVLVTLMLCFRVSSAILGYFIQKVGLKPFAKTGGRIYKPA